MEELFSFMVKAAVVFYLSKIKSHKLCLYEFLSLFFVLLVCGCVSVPETIRDIQDLTQDHMLYIDKSSSDRELITADDRKKMDDHYNSLYFEPWHREKPYYQIDIIERGFKKYRKNLGYGENGRKHRKSWLKALTARADLENYPNSSGIIAITIENADLRVMPTHKPRFFDVSYSHSGYPFDTLQESSIAPNTPVFISHMTKDKAWVLAETPYAVGWMSARSIAFVDNNFIKAWETGHYAVFLKDKIPLYDAGGRYLFSAPLGAMFPKIEEDEKNMTLLVAVADKNGKACIKTAVVPKEAATVKPLKLTHLNIAKMANELINEPYGWGGLYQNRDCSSMIKDLFAPFGIWLPRNSTDQAKEGGTFIDFQDLSPAEKESMILKQGIPYLTLLWRRGHIMLYMGNYQGKPLIFHNIWSVRTKDLLGRAGRRIVGHAAITTLNPGMELRNDDTPESNYVSGILGMAILVNPKSPEHPHPALPHQEGGKKEGGFSEERYKK
jgi:cell wall-associated NlpC family hydrolase